VTALQTSQVQNRSGNCYVLLFSKIKERKAKMRTDKIKSSIWRQMGRCGTFSVFTQFHILFLHAP
jgi:hypothetical protein